MENSYQWPWQLLYEEDLKSLKCKFIENYGTQITKWGNRILFVAFLQFVIIFPFFFLLNIDYFAKAGILGICCYVGGYAWQVLRQKVLESKDSQQPVVNNTTIVQTNMQTNNLQQYAFTFEGVGEEQDDASKVKGKTGPRDIADGELPFENLNFKSSCQNKLEPFKSKILTCEDLNALAELMVKAKQHQGNKNLFKSKLKKKGMLKWLVNEYFENKLDFKWESAYGTIYSKSQYEFWLKELGPVFQEYGILINELA